MSLFEKLETDVELEASAEKFHELYSTKPNQIPIISPQTKKGCDLVEGEWGKQGSVLRWHFEQDGVAAFIDERVKVLDNANFLTTMEMIGGTDEKSYKSCKVTAQATPKPQGCVVHWTIEYEKASDSIPDLHWLIPLFNIMTKDIDAHLTKA